MNISYYFSSPDGDVSVDSETLARPFIVEPLQIHSFLTLGDFFNVVTHFLLGKAGPILVSVLSKSWGQDVTFHDIESIIIRYEKYGALYQILSAEVVSGNLKAKFAVSAALTPKTREDIKLEYNFLSYINTKTSLPYLPHVYCINSQDIEKDDQCETIVLTLSEWFEGYHEWHFSKNNEGRDMLVIWDTERGNRSASDHEAYTIIQEASKILTLYFDLETSERIIPWHHGAGDFVVNTDSGKVEVKLVTARGYEPFTPSDACEASKTRWGLLNFFIELITKMRLDKREGIGDTTWAGGLYVSAAVDGFLQAMRMREAQEQEGFLKVDDFMASVKALNQNEIEQLIGSQLDEYQTRDVSDYEAIKAHIKEHASDIIKTLEHFSS
jgi:hypothetical protein